MLNVYVYCKYYDQYYKYIYEPVIKGHYSTILFHLILEYNSFKVLIFKYSFLPK